MTIAFAPIQALSSQLHEVIVSKLRSSLRSWGWWVRADDPKRVVLERSRVDPHMLTASHKNLGSKTFGEWYEEGERLQRTQRGVIERWNRERGSAYIWSCWRLPCQAPRRHFISFWGFNLSWCGEFLSKTHTHKQKQIKKNLYMRLCEEVSSSWRSWRLNRLSEIEDERDLKCESLSAWLSSCRWVAVSS